jgi:hypothetical protein
VPVGNDPHVEMSPASKKAAIDTGKFAMIGSALLWQQTLQTVTRRLRALKMAIPYTPWRN